MAPLMQYQMPAGIAMVPPSTGKRKSRGDADGKKTRKKKDPLAPKRPPSSYLLFQNEVRSELKKTHPGMPNNELLGMISKQWSEMSQEEKEVCMLTLVLFNSSPTRFASRNTRPCRKPLRRDTWKRKTPTKPGALQPLPFLLPWYVLVNTVIRGLTPLPQSTVAAADTAKAVVAAPDTSTSEEEDSSEEDDDDDGSSGDDSSDTTTPPHKKKKEDRKSEHSKEKEKKKKVKA